VKTIMMRWRSTARPGPRSLIIGGLLVLLGANLPAVAQIDTDSLKAQTVKITVWHKAGLAIGSGVVVCSSDDQVHVLTAAHVLYGGQQRADDTAEPRFKSITRIRVEFHQDRWPAIEGPLKEFRRRKASSKDLGLLSFPAGGRQVPAITVGQSSELQVPEKVYTMGYSRSLDKSWLLKSGDLNDTGEFLIYSAPIESGYSGGPLVDTDGRLIGVNVMANRAQEGGVTAQAIPIDEAVATCKAWMDISCLQRGTPDAGAMAGTMAGAIPATGAGGQDSPGTQRPCPVTDLDSARRCFDRLYDSDTTDKQAYLAWIAGVRQLGDGYLDPMQFQALDYWELLLEEAVDSDDMDDVADEMDGEMAYFIDTNLMASGNVDNSGAVGNSGNTMGSAYDPLLGIWIVVQITDNLGMTYVPPVVSGNLEVASLGPAAYRLGSNITINTGYEWVTYQDQIDAMLYGNTLTGTVIASTENPVGSAWQAQVSIDAAGFLYVVTPDGFVAVFQRF